MKSTPTFLKLILPALLLSGFAGQGQGNQLLNQPNQQLTQQISGRTVVLQPALERGGNAFSTQFSANATGRNDANAYLLCYLSTLIYPDYLSMRSGNERNTAFINRLHNNAADFKAEYIKYVSGLFSNPEIEFFHKSDRLGYDPEAMVISTTSALYIVFRGTDRVSSNQAGFAFDWAEWISTDFDARQISTAHHTGKVLAGMWGSLEHDGFKDELYNYIVSKGGQNKKVWITGHSLGAGQAQLFAMFMAKKGITAQGVYGFAAPNPGNQQFAGEMDRLFPNDRFQRFEFISDPITVLAQVVGCVPSGTRVYYNDVNTVEFNKRERASTEFLALVPGVAGLVANTLADYISERSNKKIDIDGLLSGNSALCYHHPTWYLKAAFQQLTETEKAAMPLPLNLPGNTDEACDRATVERGKTAPPPGAEPITVVRDVMADVLKNISIVAGTLAGNISGSVLTSGEGTYKITCLKDGKSLSVWGRCRNDNGCPVVLWQDDGGSNMRFEVYRYGAGFGLKIKGSSNEMLDVKDFSTSNGARLHTWSKHLAPVIPNNQVWYLHNVGPNRYVLQNEKSGKVLDADSPNTGNNGCEVMQWDYRKAATNQVWVFEKVN